MRPLNLASQPFKNERLPALLVTAGVVALLAVTVAHALALRHLRPRHTSALRSEVTDLEREADRLREQTRGTRVPKPDAPTLAEWALLKDLVDKRAFSWTRLFAVLEETLPDGVRLVSVAPQVAKGEMSIELQADVRSWQDGVEFLSVLQHRPEFDDVRPVQRGAEREQSSSFISYQYQMAYRPDVAAAAGPRPSASPSPAPATPAAPAGPSAASSQVGP